MIRYVAVLLWAWRCAAAPTTIYTILTPFYDAEERQRAASIVAEVFLNSPPGTRLVVMDGWNRTTICETNSPADLILDAPRAKQHALRRAAKPVQMWFKRFAASPTNELTGTSAVDLPGVLEQLPPPSGNEEAILILGSSLYQSLKEPQFSFFPDRFPADGNLFGDNAVTVFSVTEHRQRLKGRSLFMLFANERLFSSDIYRDRVARWWSLYAAQQNGKLCAFTADRVSCIPILLSGNAPALRNDHLDKRYNRVEMLSVVRPNVPYTVLTNELGGPTFLTEMRQRPGVQISPEAAAISSIERAPEASSVISVAWSQDLDLDLYVWTSPTATPLYFENTKNNSGIYVHDYQQSPGGDFETVVLNNPPEDIQSLRVALNFYRGNATEPVVGKVFIRHRGVTTFGTFAIPARTGNQGADRDNRASSPYWAEIKVDQLKPYPGTTDRN